VECSKEEYHYIVECSKVVLQHYIVDRVLD